MARFRKKPVVIEAALWDGQLVGDVVVDGKVVQGSCPNWFPAVGRVIQNKANATIREGEIAQCGDRLLIGTLEGVHEASPGDWIICGIKQELYPCKPDIFAATYDPA